MKRNLIILIGFAVVLSACSTATPTEAPVKVEDILIAGIYQNTVDPFWTSVGCGAQAEADKRGVTLELFTSVGRDADELNTLFDAALMAEPDGLFVNTDVSQQFITQIQQMMADGKPVVSNQTTDPPAQYKMIWTSPENENFIDDLLALITADEGTVGVLGGVAGIVPMEMRYVPVVEAIAEAKPGLTVLPYEYSFFDVNNATSIVEAWLIAHPDLKVIVASNGPDGVGAAAAIDAAGIAGEVALIAFDAVPPEVEALKAGTITALIAQPAFDIGANQVGALVDYLLEGNTGDVPVSTTLEGIPQRLLTKDNIDDPANVNYIYVSECP